MRRGCSILVLVAALGGFAVADDGGAPLSVAPAALAPVEPAPEAPKRLVKRPWFWIALGGAAAVIATGVALGVVYGRPRDPNATFGVVQGN
jgi:hypothetical protein